MPTNTSVENSKRMKAEISTLAQFGAIGSYEEVAKMYEVGKTTAYSYMKRLHKKAKEEKMQMKREIANDNTQVPSNVELQENVKVTVEGQKDTAEVPLVKTEDCANKSSDEPEIESNDVGKTLTDEGSEPFATVVDNSCFQNTQLMPRDAFNEVWQDIQADLAALRRMYLAQADREFSNKLELVLEATTI